VVGVLVVVEAPTVLRVPVVLTWLLVAPGIGWASRLRLRDSGETLATAIAVSIASVAIIGGGTAMLGWWDPVIVFVLLAAVSVLGIPASRHGDRAPTDVVVVPGAISEGA
jgi:hypothetical protein